MNFRLVVHVLGNRSVLVVYIAHNIIIVAAAIAYMVEYCYVHNKDTPISKTWTTNLKFTVCNHISFVFLCCIY